MRSFPLLSRVSLIAVLALSLPHRLFGQPIDNFASMRAYQEHDRVNDRVYKLLEVEAPRFIKAGRFKEAEELFEAALKLSQTAPLPGAPPVDLSRIAKVFREAGQTQTAIRILTTYQSLLEQRAKAANTSSPYLSALEAQLQRTQGKNANTDATLLRLKAEAEVAAKTNQARTAGNDAILLREILESLALAHTEMGQLDRAKESLAKAAAQKVPSYKEWLGQAPGFGQSDNGLAGEAAAKDFDERVSNSGTKRHAEALLAAREGDRERFEKVLRGRLDSYKAQLTVHLESMKQMVRKGQMPQSTVTELESRIAESDKQYGELVDREFAAALLIVGENERAAKTLDRNWKGPIGLDQRSATDSAQAFQANRVTQFQTLMRGPGGQPLDVRTRLIPNFKELSFSLATTSSDRNLRVLSATWAANLKGTTHEKHLAYNVMVAEHRDPEVGRIASELRTATSEVIANAFAEDSTNHLTPEEAMRAEASAQTAQMQKLLKEKPELLYDAIRLGAAMKEIREKRGPERPNERASRLAGELRQQLQNYKKGASPKDFNDTVKDVDPIASEYESLLVRQVGRSVLTNPWVTIDTIRDALKPGEYLIDLVTFRFFDSQAPKDEPLWKGRRYVAWIVPPTGEGEIQIVDLGDAARIDLAVDRSRQALLKAIGQDGVSGTLRELGERESEKLLRKESRALVEFVWTPLTKHLKSAKRLTVCPDGKLWLFPWEALPVGDDAYLVEKLPIRYVVSARDVIAGTADFKTTAPVIVANPTYDHGATTTPTASTPIRGVGAKESKLLPKVPPLPATAAEAQAIFPSLKEFAGQQPVLLTEDKATETRLREIRSPHTLVLATHGFVLDPDKVWNRRGFEEPMQKDGVPSWHASFVPSWHSVFGSGVSGGFDDPMLRSGILLAGCNVSGGQKDDGILTALEAMDLNLVGTRLVVLSACETALGDVREGESVAGLRQAFLLAGAKAVVATTWSIPDVESARLMKGFFGNLAQGQSQQEALRNAQLAQIKARRDKFGAAHPFFWAAYTLTGSEPNRPGK